jgi:hypothetical protein
MVSESPEQIRNTRKFYERKKRRLPPAKSTSAIAFGNHQFRDAIMAVLQARMSSSFSIFRSSGGRRGQDIEEQTRAIGREETE